mmetsp:Transcript_24140/g.67820  ORF Transcript_24140/g.67820 Transcript_24140/m.67820 type:complete len:244 (+) Transcript_24140:162-893(+)
MSTSRISISMPSSERSAKRSPCWYRLCTVQDRSAAPVLRHTIAGTTREGSCFFLPTWLMFSADRVATPAPLSEWSSASVNPRTEATSTGCRAVPSGKRCSILHCLLFCTLNTQIAPPSSAATTLSCFWASTSADTIRPSKFGHSISRASIVSKSTNPQTPPHAKTTVPKCTEKLSTAASTPVLIRACNVPFRVMTVMLPPGCPTMKYFVPCCEAMASALTGQRRPSVPFGILICLLNCVVTLT